MPKVSNDGRNPQTGGSETTEIQSTSIITRIRNLMGMGSDGSEIYSGEIRIKILQPVAGIYGLSANIGEEIEIDAKQGTEMISSGHAEIVE